MVAGGGWGGGIAATRRCGEGDVMTEVYGEDRQESKRESRARERGRGRETESENESKREIERGREKQKRTVVEREREGERQRAICEHQATHTHLF